MSTEIVKVFMLICIISIAGMGYLFVSQQMGFAPTIVQNSTGANSTFYTEGQSLVTGLNLYSSLMIVFVLVLVTIAFIIIWKKYQ